MEFSEKVQQYIYRHHLFTKNDALLVAVSGGADSVVLCHILQQLGYTFSMAHCNFQLRGEESNRDEQFVTALANQLAVPYFVKKMETEQYKKEHNVNTQVAARNLRYDWFASLINETTKQPFTHILTAHHLNDSIETVLLNFCKGTGVAGLHGILPKQQNIIRPLLSVTRTEVENYASQNGIAFISDSSNKEDAYTRNFLRNQVLPLLQEKFPTIESNITLTMERMQETEILYKEVIEQKKQKIVTIKGMEVHIPIYKLIKEKAYKTILYEIVKDYGFATTQLEEIVKLFEAKNSSYIKSSTHQIFKNRNWLIITKLQSIASEYYIIEEGQLVQQFALGTIQMETVEAKDFVNDANIALLNSAKITFPLILRKWKEGDYFYPLGMQKKKKVARFLIDLKLSKTEKENVWVVELNKKIAWVVGYRIDERYKAALGKPALSFTFKR